MYKNPECLPTKKSGRFLSLACLSLYSSSTPILISSFKSYSGPSSVKSQTPQLGAPPLADSSFIPSSFCSSSVVLWNLRSRVHCYLANHRIFRNSMIYSSFSSCSMIRTMEKSSRRESFGSNISFKFSSFSSVSCSGSFPNKRYKHHLHIS